MGHPRWLVFAQATAQARLNGGVHAVVVARREVDRPGLPALELDALGQGTQQLGDRIGAALGLQDGPRLDAVLGLQPTVTG